MKADIGEMQLQVKESHTWPANLQQREAGWNRLPFTALKRNRRGQCLDLGHLASEP